MLSKHAAPSLWQRDPVPTGLGLQSYEGPTHCGTAGSQQDTLPGQLLMLFLCLGFLICKKQPWPTQDCLTLELSILLKKKKSMPRQHVKGAECSEPWQSCHLFLLH